MRERWADDAKEVRELCIVAIEKRNEFRLYIRWLEAEIRELAKTPLPEKSEPKQLILPFAT